MPLPSLLTRATAAVDRQVLRFMERRMRTGAPRKLDDARERLLELAERYGTDTLGTPSRFFPEPPPAEMREKQVGDGVIDLSYASTYKPFVRSYLDEHERWRANLVAHARLYTRGPKRPTIVILHGWGGGAYFFEERAFVVPYWLRLGYDVALAQLPFHGERAERDMRSGALFPSAHLVRTNEGFGQAIHDLRALATWLRARGASAIGAMGMSLGGYTTALWSTIEPLDFAVAMIPAVSMSDLMWRHGEQSPARRAAEKAGVSGDLLDDVFRVHAPTTRPPRVARERLMIVAGRGDRITPPDHAEMLRAHWGGCAIHWFPGGHLAQVGRGDAFRAVRRHLEQIR
ncbi:MAG TPA: alpha/beta hydrolase family protein [Kofleriaceae bacterium]|nr:alpha/beta hydrolase family protein [Kofleriaceae bacterium]